MQGQQGGSEDKPLATEDLSAILNPFGERRDLTLKSYPLTSTLVSSWVCSHK